VSVTTAHKILIATAIGFFILYALWELARFARTGAGDALGVSAVATLAALGLALYLRRFIRSLGRP
jgi:hypothetical protein